VASDGARRNMCSWSLRESLIREFHLRQTRWIANSVVASRDRQMSSRSSVVLRTWDCTFVPGSSIVTEENEWCAEGQPLVGSLILTSGIEFP
jgi:hypothetical protein